MDSSAIPHRPSVFNIHFVHELCINIFGAIVETLSLRVGEYQLFSYVRASRVFAIPLC